MTKIGSFSENNGLQLMHDFTLLAVLKNFHTRHEIVTHTDTDDTEIYFEKKLHDHDSFIKKAFFTDFCVAIIILSVFLRLTTADDSKLGLFPTMSFPKTNYTEIKLSSVDNSVLSKLFNKLFFIRISVIKAPRLDSALLNIANHRCSHLYACIIDNLH